MRIKFLDWRPDAEDSAHGGLTEALNVVHDSEGYKEWRSGLSTTTLTSIRFGDLASWLDLRNLGYESNAYLGIAHFSTINSVQIGTVGVWSEYVDTAPAGRTGGALQCYSVCELEDTIVVGALYNWNSASATPGATTVASGYISYALGTYGAGSSWNTIDVTDAYIVCGKVNNFAVLGNEYEGNPVPDRSKIRWSAIGDATDWPTPNTDDARSKQSGQEFLPTELGEVTAITGDDFFGYVFQESGVTKMTYVGGDVVFSFDTFEESRGCGYYERFTRVDDMVFFESKYNRHMLQNGQIIDIGYGVVDDTYPPVTGYFKLRKNVALGLIFFSNYLVYNYKTGQWTRTDANDPVLSINDKDGVIAYWTAANGATYTYTTEGGTPKEATIATAATDINKGGRSVINGIRPLANGGTFAVRIGVQDDLSDSVTWVTASSVNSRTGFANARAEGRYLRGEVKISGGFETALGADVDFKPTGKV